MAEANTAKETTKGYGRKEEVTFFRDLVLTGYSQQKIDSTDPSRPPAIWHRLSMSDGSGLNWTNVTADKECRGDLATVFQKYKVGFKVSQEITKNETSFFRVKVVYLEKL